MHGYDLYKDRNETEYILFQNQIIKCCAMILGISNDGINYLYSNYPDFKNKFRLNRLGTSIPNLPIYRKQENLRIISIGHLVRVKRIDLIAKTLSDIKDINIHWVHIGDGPEKTLILNHTTNFSENIRFELKGHLSPQQVIHYLTINQFDLLVNTSSSEGIPVSIMEAMSFGIPVIATDVGGVSEIVNNTNGMLLPKAMQSEMLADSLRIFHNMPERSIEQFRISARNTVKNHYNGKENAKSLVKLLNEVASPNIHF